MKVLEREAGEVSHGGGYSFELLTTLLGLCGRHYSDSARSPSSAQTGATKSEVFGRVEMGIRARGIDEGADGVAIFYPAKTWLGSWIHLVMKQALFEWN
jgi:hypothetical protein